MSDLVEVFRRTLISRKILRIRNANCFFLFFFFGTVKRDRFADDITLKSVLECNKIVKL